MGQQLDDSPPEAWYGRALATSTAAAKKQN